MCCTLTDMVTTVRESLRGEMTSISDNATVGTGCGRRASAINTGKGSYKLYAKSDLQIHEEDFLSS